MSSKKPPKRRCADCGRFTVAGPCEGCGKVFCQACAEKPYAFCCDVDANEDVPK